jgi:hypothetical protein
VGKRELYGWRRVWSIGAVGAFEMEVALGSGLAGAAELWLRAMASARLLLHRVTHISYALLFVLT